jgi:hypothetical protein
MVTGDTDHHWHSWNLDADGLHLDSAPKPMIFETASVTLLDRDGRYNIYGIPFSAISPEELRCMYVLHEECKITDSHDNPSTIEPALMAQMQMNFLSSVDVRNLQDIYRAKWGHEYLNVGKWEQCARENIRHVYVLRSSYPFVHNYVTLE